MTVVFYRIGGILPPQDHGGGGTMWSRLRIDMGWPDMAAGIAGCFSACRRDRWLARCERRWSANGDAVICTSIRSGFDLLLQALQLPVGSEVAFSAVNIPDMARIAREHGLRPVPIDLGCDSWTPSLSSLRRAVGPNTRMIVIAHLFGLRLDLSPVIKLAQQHGNLLVVEDCAQAFAGSEYRGHPGSDVSLFSFGPIKTATALGGGVTTVRDGDLRTRMSMLQDSYPVQSRWTYLRRMAKYAGLKTVTYPPVMSSVGWCVQRYGADPETVLSGAARNYRETDLLSQLRQRPCAPLLAMLHRRWKRFNVQRLMDRTAKGSRLADRIGGAPPPPDPDALPIRADAGWLFPLLSLDDTLVPELRRAGYDATSQSRLMVIPPPEDRRDLAAVQAARSIERMIVVPCYPELPDGELDRLAAIVRGRVILPARLAT